MRTKTPTLATRLTWGNTWSNQLLCSCSQRFNPSQRVELKSHQGPYWHLHVFNHLSGELLLDITGHRVTTEIIFLVIDTNVPIKRCCWAPILNSRYGNVNHTHVDGSSGFFAHLTHLHPFTSIMLPLKCTSSKRPSWDHVNQSYESAQLVRLETWRHAWGI